MSEVRRKDYEQTDRDAILAFVDASTHGHLAFVRPDGSPGIAALNFARVGETLYFHGATEGEKAESLAREPRVSFMIDADFAVVPSYFRDTELACPATQYYRAVVVHGVMRFVATRDEKAIGLQALMEKLQPEGGHRPIRGDDPVYAKSLDTTAVLALPMTTVTAKFKFGQNLPKAKRRRVAERLLGRGRNGDAESVAAMCEIGADFGLRPGVTRA